MAADLMRLSGGRVISGPFQGTQFTDELYWSSFDISPFLLGTYEIEIQDDILKFCRKSPTIVNIGCGDGYYPVCLLRSGYAHRAICYETNKKSRETASKLARLNNVEEQLSLHETFELANIDNIPEGAFLLCDIEGAEYDLFDTRSIECLRKSPIIVEMHAASNDDERIAEFVSRFRKTHWCKTRILDSRDLSNPSALQNFSMTKRLLALTEGRSRGCQWLVAEPVAYEEP